MKRLAEVSICEDCTIKEFKMKKFFLLFILFVLSQASVQNIECRFAGIVIDYKILSFELDSSVICWVQTNNSQYSVKGTFGLPKIYVGDSLFEYWINYDRCCVGTKNNSILMYPIIKR